MEDTQPPFDIALSDQFKYDEAVFAAYAALNKNWDPWTLKVGLRGEHTEVKARSETLDEINRQSYFELFPSFYLGRQMGDDHSLAFTYSRQLTRPPGSVTANSGHLLAVLTTSTAIAICSVSAFP